MEHNTFVTAITCMDGRVQMPVNDYLKDKYNVRYIDTITLAAPCMILSGVGHQSLIENIRFRMDISVNQHNSRLVAVIGHYDCAAAPVSDEEQIELIHKSVELIREWYCDIQVIGLWIDETWTVHKLENKTKQRALCL